MPGPGESVITQGIKEVIRAHCDQMPLRERIIRARNLARIYCIDKGDYCELAQLAGIEEGRLA